MDTELHPVDREPEATRVAGVLAEFKTAEELVEAAVKVRDRGYKRWDCFTPFPVHGLDDAMGIRFTILPAIVLCGGLTGLTIALTFQCWANGVNYPWIISGKPLFSIPAFIPVTFEFTILFSALTTFFGVLLMNQLPQLYHPTARVERFARASMDRFFIMLEARDKQFKVDDATAFLQTLGPSWTGTCEEPAKPSPYPFLLKPALILGALLLAIVPAMIANARNTKSELPRIHIVQDMDFQQKFKPQTAISEDLFVDGRAMRYPAPGVVARGEINADAHFFEGKVNGELAKSLPVMKKSRAELMVRGQQQFTIHCSVCHGAAADGKGLVHLRATELKEGTWIPPLSFHDERLRGVPDGHIFEVITKGIRTMPPYGHKVPPQDRWAIILYVRALQLSQFAPLDDVTPENRDKIRPQ